MKRLKKICALALIVTTLNLTFFGMVFANYTNKTSITEVPVEIRSTPSKNMPGKDEESWLSKYKWWILGGVVLIAGGAAAGAAGGGGEDPPNNEGNYTVTW